MIENFLSPTLAHEFSKSVWARDSRICGKAACSSFTGGPDPWPLAIDVRGGRGRETGDGGLGYGQSACLARLAASLLRVCLIVTFGLCFEPSMSSVVFDRLSPTCYWQMSDCLARKFSNFLQAVRREIAYIGSVSWEALCRSCLVFLLTWLRPEMAGPGNGTPACVWEARRALLPGWGTTLWAPPPQWRSEEESTFEEIFLCFRSRRWDSGLAVLLVRNFGCLLRKILKSFPGSGSLVSLAKGALWRTFHFATFAR